jgi:putative membrane-bound dehydrogenase-like protein
MQNPIIAHLSRKWLVLLVAFLPSSNRATAALAQSLPSCARGWEVKVVASAPRIKHPTAVACAPDGRVFVCEDKMDMSGPVDRPVNRIVCLHPGGRFTVFAEQIYAAFSMEYIDGKLYVHHSPKFSVFADGGDTGKDRVDLIEMTNPAPWGSAVRGKNQINDHAPAGFQPAMDGYLYIAVGDKGIHGMAGRDGTKLELPVGGLIRMRLDGTKLETFATGFRTVLNPAINAEGAIFLFDNNDHLNFHKVAVGQVHDGGYYGYPWDSRPPRPGYVLPMDVRVFGGGAPTGILAYEEDALPAPYRGNLFLCDWGRQELVRLTLERSGAGYRVIAEEKVLSGAFRPTGIAIAPDGKSFYLGDWQFPGWREDVVAGRLLEVRYTGARAAAPKPAWYLPAAMGRAFQATTDELIAGLGHPSRAVRMVAQRRLQDRSRESVAPLVRALRDRAGATPARWHAIWALDAQCGGQAGRQAILDAVDDAAPSVRIQAIRALATRRHAAARGRLVARCTDPDAAVRFEAVTALGRIGAADVVPAARDRLGDDDPLVRYAAFTALNRIGRADPAAWGHIIAGLASDRPHLREATAFALRETYEPSLIAALVRFAGRSTQPGFARAAGYRALFALARQPPEWDGLWWRLGPHGYIEDSYEARPSLPKTTSWAGTAAVMEALSLALGDPDAQVRRAAIEAAKLNLDRAVVARLVGLFDDPAMSADRPAILRALGAATEPAATGPILAVIEHPQELPDLVSVALAAAREQRSPRVTAAITKLAGTEIPPPALAVALRALGELRVSEAVPTVRRRLAHGAAEVRVAAANALAQIANNEAVPGLVSCLSDPDAAVRRAALAGLRSLRTKSAVPALMRARSDPITGLDAIAALAVVHDVRAVDAYLEGLTAKRPGLREECSKALSALREPAWPLIRAKLAAHTLAPAVLADLKSLYGDDPSTAHLFGSARQRATPAEYSEFARSGRGNPERGQRIFADPRGVGCAKCHRVDGAGGEGGPDLSHIGSTSNRAELIDAILSPSKQVAEGFRMTTLALADGVVVSGVVIDVKGETMTLVDTRGERRVIRKRDIEDKGQRDLSAMPDGLQSGLTLQEFADLVAYLESLK